MGVVHEMILVLDVDDKTILEEINSYFPGEIGFKYLVDTEIHFTDVATMRCKSLLFHDFVQHLLAINWPEFCYVTLITHNNHYLGHQILNLHEGCRFPRAEILRKLKSGEL